MAVGFDWKALKVVLFSTFKSISGVPFYESGYAGEVDAMPYGVYKITTPKINIISNRDPSFEPFECVVSVTFYDTDSTNALQLSDDLETLLRTDEKRQLLRDNGIVIVDVGEPDERGIRLPYDTQYQYGLDIRLRLMKTFNDSIPSIDNLSIGVNDSNINI